MLMISTAPSNPVRHVVSTMQQANPRLLRLVRALAFAFIFISLVVAVMGCSPKLHIANEGLDQATLMLFALLPMLYFSGKQNQSSPRP